MPIHDWTQVPGELYHDFHQTWTVEIARSLNGGLLPKEFPALIERQRSIEDVVDLPISRRPLSRLPEMIELPSDLTNCIIVRRGLGEAVAAIVIPTERHWADELAFTRLMRGAARLFIAGINSLVVNLFPAIWNEGVGRQRAFPIVGDCILSANNAEQQRCVRREWLRVGDPLPDLPLFLGEGRHVLVPLDAAYQRAWGATSDIMRVAVETGVLPADDS